QVFFTLSHISSPLLYFPLPLSTCLDLPLSPGNTILSHTVTSPSDPNLCPICGAKIPFSLALHMIAIHSPAAKERSAACTWQECPELRACLENSSRRREEAEKHAIRARNPPPHVGGYAAQAILK